MKLTDEQKNNLINRQRVEVVLSRNRAEVGIRQGLTREEIKEDIIEYQSNKKIYQRLIEEYGHSGDSCDHYWQELELNNE